MSRYYHDVADYYDQDAISFEQRYWSNIVLQKIRQGFREHLYQHDFESVLEIGSGTGIDLLHLGKAYPEKKIYGIDISPQMVAYSRQKLEMERLSNVRVEAGTIETVRDVFGNMKFDLIFVFFGAFNTTENISNIPGQLSDILSENGKVILTFVNKWYLAEILIHLMKLRPGKAFKRIKPIWGGYSNEKFLESKCYSSKQIKKLFENRFTIQAQRGYSILYPAWYRHNWVGKLGPRISHLLWVFDEWINKTIFWSTGEYFLYSFSRRS